MSIQTNTGGDLPVQSVDQSVSLNENTNTTNTKELGGDPDSCT
jgi:hypothetical protein